MDAAKEREHLLALKVMRLTKPALISTPLVLACDELHDLPLDSFRSLATSDLAILPSMQHFALGEILTLPQNFGNIFLGETFSSYISIHNDSKQICREILIKADLQTSSQRLTLTGANAPLATELQPDCSIDEVIHHEVKELGTHILVCAVSYTNASGEKQYFRKFFKFHVLKPLDVKTKFYHTESDDVYLEAQIQNITPGPIYLERVPLEPSPLYSVREFTTENTENSGAVVSRQRTDCLSAMDVRQYLYCLTPRAEACTDVRLLKGVTNIGKLDIMWKTNMGERGRLQTSPLQRVAPGSGDVKLAVEHIPQMVAVGATFHLRLKVTNCCEQRTMDLQLTTVNNTATGLVWTGLSGRSLGKVESCATLDLDLCLIAIRTGLLTVSGLRLTDTFLKRTYEHDEIAHVFVLAETDVEAVASSHQL